MKFTYKGKVYRIWFQHFTDPTYVRRTECSVVEVVVEPSPGVHGEYYEVGQNDAMCHTKDTYNRSVGRKLSLARCLAAMTTDRAFRRTAWMAYHNRGGKNTIPSSATMTITGNGEIQ